MENSQSIKSVLETADRKAARPVITAHARSAADEEQAGDAARARVTNRTAPTGAETAHTEERSIATGPAAGCC